MAVLRGLVKRGAALEVARRPARLRLARGLVDLSRRLEQQPHDLEPAVLGALGTHEQGLLLCELTLDDRGEEEGSEESAPAAELAK